MSTTLNEQSIAAHYLIAHDGPGALTTTILAAMRAAGKDPDALTPDDLAPVDQFHIRGKAATLELAQRSGIHANMRVLDVGGGIGGPARTLASAVGCTVTVLDLTEAYCQTGESLTACTHLSHLVTFQHGSALDMPFSDGSFDVVWTQHSSMNIADKAQLYAECARVLRPGGRLALHEVMAGPMSPLHFPVPWARQPEISFLLPPVSVREMIIANGFREVAWINESTIDRQWFQERLATPPTPGLPSLGLHLLLGSDFGTMFRNYAQNLQEQRIVIIQGVFERS